MSEEGKKERRKGCRGEYPWPCLVQEGMRERGSVPRSDRRVAIKGGGQAAPHGSTVRGAEGLVVRARQDSR